MYWTKIRLRCGSTNIDLPLVGATVSDPFILKNIDGLGPPEVVVSITDTPGPGGIYKGRRPRNRQLIARVGLNPDYSVGQTVESLRKMTYKLLNGAVNVIIMDGASEVCSTRGWVSKPDYSIFSKDPEVSITIDCDTPYLKQSDMVTVPIESLSISDLVITNPGDAPTGFNMTFVVTETMYTFGIVTMAEPFDSFAFDMIGEVGDSSLELFNVGDIIHINTTPGSKTATRTRGGVVSSLLGNIFNPSVWPLLNDGDNNFTIVNGGKTFTWTDVSFYPNHWGV